MQRGGISARVDPTKASNIALRAHLAASE